MSEYVEYCENCGSRIREPSAFCSNCGDALTELEPAGMPTGHASARGDGRGGAAAQAPGASVTPDATQAAAPPRSTAPPSSRRAAEHRQSGAPPAGDPPAAADQTAEQPPPEASSRNWIPFAALGTGALVAAGAVVTLLLALGGSAGEDVKSSSITRQQALQLLAANGTTTISRGAPGLFALVTAGKLTAIVPAGWQATAQTAGVTTRAEFADPKHQTSTLTIVAQSAQGGSDHSRAVAAREAVSGKGYPVDSFATVTFPGGRQAWQLTYTASGTTHRTYFYTVCSGHTAMVVDVATNSSTFSQQQTSLDAAASSAEPSC
jgi:hypothetical protein